MFAVGISAAATSGTTQPLAGEEVSLFGGGRATVFPLYVGSALIDEITLAIAEDDEERVHALGMGNCYHPSVVESIVPLLPIPMTPAGAAFAAYLLVSNEPLQVLEAVLKHNRLDVLLLSLSTEAGNAEAHFVAALSHRWKETSDAALRLRPSLYPALVCAAESIAKHGDAHLAAEITVAGLQNAPQDGLEARIHDAMHALAPGIAARPEILARIGSTSALVLLVGMWVEDSMLESMRSAVLTAIIDVANGLPHPPPGGSVAPNTTTALDLVLHDLPQATFLVAVLVCLIPDARPWNVSFSDDNIELAFGSLLDLVSRLWSSPVAMGAFHTNPADLVFSKSPRPIPIPPDSKRFLRLPVKPGRLHAGRFFSK